ncbi:MAG: LamG-like jellyroll fold domain-containing protein [Pseudomonadota bacterium]
MSQGKVTGIDWSGSDGNDTKDGGSEADTLRGLGGNDRLDGLADDDRLYGGTGDDTLYGDHGKDKLYGEDDNDSLLGGEDEDVLHGGKGSDALEGGADDDLLDGGEGDDILRGGDGDNVLFGYDGADRFELLLSDTGISRNYILDFDAEEGDKITVYTPDGTEGTGLQKMIFESREIVNGQLTWAYTIVDASNYIIPSRDPITDYGQVLSQVRLDIGDFESDDGWGLTIIRHGDDDPARFNTKSIDTSFDAFDLDQAIETMDGEGIVNIAGHYVRAVSQINGSQDSSFHQDGGDIAVVGSEQLRIFLDKNLNNQTIVQADSLSQSVFKAQVSLTYKVESTIGDVWTLTKHTPFSTINHTAEQLTGLLDTYIGNVLNFRPHGSTGASEPTEIENLVIYNRPNLLFDARWEVVGNAGGAAYDGYGSLQRMTYKDGVGIVSESGLAADPAFAFDFDGTDTAVMELDTAIDFSDGADGYTIAGHVRFDDLAGRWQRFFDLGNGPGADNIIVTQISGTDDIEFSIRDGGTKIGEVIARDVLVENAWIHLGATFDDDGMTLYVDGQKMGEDAFGAGVDLPDVDRANLFFGYSNYVADDALDGQMREIVVAKRVLSEREMLSLAGDKWELERFADTVTKRQEGGSDFAPTTNDDVFYFGNGDDVWVDDLGGHDTIFAGGGNDHVEGGIGNDSLYGGAGDDVLFGNNRDDLLVGGDGADILHGGQAHDVLYGEQGNDTLNGDNGNDALFGGLGDDVLSGNGHDDALRGGAGDDTLDGGTGVDTFLFNEEEDGGAQVDRIIDIEVGETVILQNYFVLTNYNPAVPDSIDPYITANADGDAVLNLGGGESIIFVGRSETFVEDNVAFDVSDMLVA